MTDRSAATRSGATMSPRQADGGPIVSHSSRNDWRPAPIEPSWILSGRPAAQYIPLGGGEDGYSTLSLWRCTEGRFRWTFHWEESVYITAGEVEVTAADGSVSILRPGSVALFQAGSTAIWNVTSPVQKMAVCRRALPARVARWIRRLRKPWSLPLLAIALVTTLVGVDLVFA